MSIDAHRPLRQAMLRRIADEQRGREHLARCRDESEGPFARIVMTMLIATCAALTAYLLLGQP